MLEESIQKTDEIELLIENYKDLEAVRKQYECRLDLQMTQLLGRRIPGLEDKERVEEESICMCVIFFK